MIEKQRIQKPKKNKKLITEKVGQNYTERFESQEIGAKREDDKMLNRSGRGGSCTK